MLFDVRLLGCTIALLLVIAIWLMSAGELLYSVIALFAIGLIVSHIKRHEKYYDSELDDIFGKDDELV